MKLTKPILTLMACLAVTTLSAQETVTNAFDDLQRKGKVVESESEMRIKPTAIQVTKMVNQLPESGYFCFTEDRNNSVRMFDIIPQRWATREVEELNQFSGTAQPNEFFTFQIAAWAVKKELRNVTVEFSDMKNSHGDTLTKSALRCFNTGGTDLKGKRFEKTVDIPRRAIQPFWIGIDLPKTAKGTYTGTMTIKPTNAQPTKIDVTLTVAGEVLEGKGTYTGESMARLMWLDSQIAVNDQPTKPYIPLTVKGSTINYLGGSITIGKNGLPSSIVTNYTQMNQIDRKVKNEILSSPMQFIIKSGGVAETFDTPKVSIEMANAGKAAWTTQLSSLNFDVRIHGIFEFDGMSDFSIEVTPKSDITVEDMRLEVPYTYMASKYIVGIGYTGGKRHDKTYKWKWDVTKHQDAVWMGGVNAGLNFKFKDKNYVRPLVNIYYQYGRLNVPKSWGTGGIEIAENGLLSAYSSSKQLSKGETVDFGVEMLITPVKPLDWAAQINQRMYHSNSDVSDKYIEAASKAGANLINIHHKKDFYPYINYPYYDPAMADFQKFIGDASAKGIGTRVYYTTRELTVKIPEIWALRSMGDEIIHSGMGEYQATLICGDGPNKWLSENLKTDFIPAWYNAFNDGKYKGEMDISVITTPDSRWNNYFLEGLNFMVKRMNMMGVYIDDSALDRQTLKRARNILDEDGKRRMIDIHSWNHFNDWAGFANSLHMYTDLLPYIDKIWIGEGFGADNALDFWMVEMAGIPFGMMSETLDAHNLFRGMIFSMTPRLPWSGNPVPVWKMWDSFKMQNARMVGYWCDDAPIRSDRAEAPVTTYINGNKAIVVCANWTDKPLTARLSIDEKLLGFKPSKAKFIELEGTQKEGLFDLNTPKEIDGRSGFIVLLEK